MDIQDYFELAYELVMLHPWPILSKIVHLNCYCNGFLLETSICLKLVSFEYCNEENRFVTNLHND